MSNDKRPTALHAVLFLGRMLARDGSFPVQYLDGFQRLVDDILAAAPDEEYSVAVRADVKQSVLQIIAEARGKAGLE